MERLLAGGIRRRPSDMTYHWLCLSPVRPVQCIRSEPERQEFEFDAAGLGMLVVGALAYPGWEAKITLSNGATMPAQTLNEQAGCLLVRIPSPGKQRVELTFHARSFERGLAISCAALVVWLVAVLFAASAVKRTTRPPAPGP